MLRAPLRSTRGDRVDGNGRGTGVGRRFGGFWVTSLWSGPLHAEVGQSLAAPGSGPVRRRIVRECFERGGPEAAGKLSAHLP
eukprot:2347598-Pyramimonas_sp.AAC.1